MAKIYGYKDKDVIGLAQFILERKGGSLTETFRLYSLKTGKAHGTVRNMYYALAKHSVKDKEFTQKYLGGNTLAVGKIEEFTKAEEQELVTKILEKKEQGMSVRSAINELAGGDMKLALRYQNKYRNLIKQNPSISGKTAQGAGVTGLKSGEDCQVSASQYLKLKKEIDGLVGRIAQKVRRENELLKARIEVLELENLRLNNLLYASENAKGALSFLRPNGKKGVLN